MAGDSTFNYDGLFAKSAPEPRQRVAARRAKYDFLVAYPDPESLPLDELVESLRGALQEEGKGLAVYPHPQGYPPLREYVASKLARDRGMDVSADNIILGDGSGQHLQVITEALVDPGDVVLTDEFVYGGTLATLRRFRADIQGVPCDDEGMQPDAVESALERVSSEGKKTKIIYTIPTFQNPQGWTMSLERRKALVRISQRYDVPILEDDCYVDLQYDGEPVPSIHSLDDTGRVLYVGSFSKIIAPGMRLGYMTGPPEFIDRAMAIKSGGGVNQLAALAVHRFSPRLDGHINKVKDILRVKRDTMLAALGENFGTAATWSRPEGGLYIWLRMPEGTDLTAVQEAAFSADVGFSVGTALAADGVSGRNYARLCFGYNTPEEIHEGIARLAEVFAQQGVLKA